MTATPIPRYTPFQIEVAGRRYNATWHVEADSVVVSSAYGSAAAALRGAQPVAVAEHLLGRMVTNQRN